MADIVVIRNMGNHFPIAAMPKSASTFVSLVLARYLGQDHVAQYCSGHSSEDDFDYESVLHAYYEENKKTVGQYHMRATRRNLEYIKKYRMKTVFITRHLPDVVMSLHDHLLKHVQGDSSAYRFAFLTPVDPKGFLSFSERERYEFIIDHYIPWYLNFYAGWKLAQREDPDIESLLMHLAYEDHQKDNLKSLVRILKFYGVEPNKKRLEEVIQLVKGNRTRYNKAQVGRGMKMIPLDLLEKIRDLTCSVAQHHYLDIKDLLPEELIKRG